MSKKEPMIISGKEDARLEEWTRDTVTINRIQLSHNAIGPFHLLCYLRLTAISNNRTILSIFKLSFNWHSFLFYSILQSMYRESSPRLSSLEASKFLAGWLPHFYIQNELKNVEKSVQAERKILLFFLNIDNDIAMFSWLKVKRGQGSNLKSLD